MVWKKNMITQLPGSKQCIREWTHGETTRSTMRQKPRRTGRYSTMSWESTTPIPPIQDLLIRASSMMRPSHRRHSFKSINQRGLDHTRTLNSEIQASTGRDLMIFRSMQATKCMAQLKTCTIPIILTLDTSRVATMRLRRSQHRAEFRFTIVTRWSFLMTKMINLISLSKLMLRVSLRTKSDLLIVQGTWPEPNKECLLKKMLLRKEKLKRRRSPRSMMPMVMVSRTTDYQPMRSSTRTINQLHLVLLRACIIHWMVKCQVTIIKDSMTNKWSQ